MKPPIGASENGDGGILRLFQALGSLTGLAGNYCEQSCLVVETSKRVVFL